MKREREDRNDKGIGVGWKCPILSLHLPLLSSPGIHYLILDLFPLLLHRHRRTRNGVITTEIIWSRYGEEMVCVLLYLALPVLSLHSFLSCVWESKEGHTKTHHSLAVHSFLSLLPSLSHVGRSYRAEARHEDRSKRWKENNKSWKCIAWRHRSVFSIPSRLHESRIGWRKTWHTTGESGYNVIWKALKYLLFPAFVSQLFSIPSLILYLISTSLSLEHTVNSMTYKPEEGIYYLETLPSVSFATSFHIPCLQVMLKRFGMGS